VDCASDSSAEARCPRGTISVPPTSPGPAAWGVEIVVEVDDVDAAFAPAREAAVTLGGQIEPLAGRPWGLTDFRLIDPDGYYIRVTSTG